MATPRVLGQELRLTANLCLARPASAEDVSKCSFLPSFSFSGPVQRTKEGLVGTSTTGNDTDHATDGALDDLLGARRKLDAGLALVGVVANDGNVVARGTAERTTVANLLLNVGDDSSLRDGAEGEDVADGEGSVLAGVDELAGVHALVGDEGLGVELVAVGVAEDDLGQRSATAGVVDDLLHDTTDVTMTLGEVESAELRRRLVEPFAKMLVCGSEVCASRWWWFRTGVGSEDRATALPLVANDTTLQLSASCPPSSSILSLVCSYHLFVCPGRRSLFVGRSSQQSKFLSQSVEFAQRQVRSLGTFQVRIYPPGYFY